MKSTGAQGGDDKTPKSAIMRKLTLGAQSRLAERQKHDKIMEEEMKKFIEYSNIVYNDEQLGVPEAQAAMEVIKNFNQDMLKM